MFPPLPPSQPKILYETLYCLLLSMGQAACHALFLLRTALRKQVTPYIETGCKIVLTWSMYFVDVLNGIYTIVKLASVGLTQHLTLHCVTDMLL